MSKTIDIAGAAAEGAAGVSEAETGHQNGIRIETETGNIQGTRTIKTDSFSESTITGARQQELSTSVIYGSIRCQDDSSGKADLETEQSLRGFFNYEEILKLSNAY